MQVSRARTLLAVGATTALTAATIAATSGTSSAAPTWAPADSATIHPGVQMYTEGAQCTANFVFTDGAGNTYVGYAAHCAGTGEATDTVRVLRNEGDGDLVVLGSGALVRDLAAADLVDRYVLTTIPVVLGRGARLFEGTPISLAVESSTTSPTGIVVATYRVLRD